MLKRKLTKWGAAVMAVGIGALLMPPVAHAALGTISVTTPPPSPLLMPGKATVAATVADGTVLRKSEILDFAMAQPVKAGDAKVVAATTKANLAITAVGLSVITFTGSLAPQGFFVGEDVKIDDPAGRETVTIASILTVPVPTWTLTAPMKSMHPAGVVISGGWAATDPTTGAAAQATVIAGSVPGPQQVTVTDVTDPTVAPITVDFTQSPPGPPPPPPTQTERFVASVYQDLLNRAVDLGSLNFWAGIIDAAGSSVASRGAFVSAVLRSNEYRTDVISTFYLLYLNRAVDNAGLQFWVGQMSVGLSFERVRLAFVGSPEFFNSPSTNNGDPAKAINALYTEVLGRPDGDASDPPGAAYWLAHFNVNTIASQFLFSPEGRQFLVEGYYLSILHRAADPSGLAFWTQQLLAGASDEDILLQLVSSDEYLSHV